MKTKKVYYIDFCSLDSRINYGYLTKNSNAKSNTLVKVNLNGNITMLRKEDVYFKETDAEEKLKVYLAKKKYKLEWRNKVCKCFYCKKDLEYLEFTVDHKKCISEYPHLAADKRNFAIACEDCNKEKSDQDFLEFKQKKNKELKIGSLIEQKKMTRSRKTTEKISRTINCNSDDVMEFAKKDSRTWSVETFFNKNNCSV